MYMRKEILLLHLPFKNDVVVVQMQKLDADVRIAINKFKIFKYTKDD